MMLMTSCLLPVVNVGLVVIGYPSCCYIRVRLSKKKKVGISVLETCQYRASNENFRQYVVQELHGLRAYSEF